MQDTAAAMVDATTDARLALALMAGARVELYPAMVWLEVVLAAGAAVQLVPGNGARPSLTSQEAWPRCSTRQWRSGTVCAWCR